MKTFFKRLFPDSTAVMAEDSAQVNPPTGVELGPEELIAA